MARPVARLSAVAVQNVEIAWTSQRGFNNTKAIVHGGNKIVNKKKSTPKDTFPWPRPCPSTK
jgi:hypothetical protein